MLVRKGSKKEGKHAHVDDDCDDESTWNAICLLKLNKKRIVESITREDHFILSNGNYSCISLCMLEKYEL